MAQESPAAGYRERAAELRDAAAKATDETVIVRLLVMAAEFELLAGYAEHRRPRAAHDD